MSVNNCNGHNGHEDSEDAETGRTEPTESVTGEISIHIDEGAIRLDGYPHGDLAHGEGFLFTHDDRELFLGVKSKEDGRAFEGVFYFDPETADKVADLLRKYAEKTRDPDCVEASYP